MSDILVVRISHREDESEVRAGWEAYYDDLGVDINDPDIRAKIERFVSDYPYWRRIIDSDKDDDGA